MTSDEMTSFSIGASQWAGASKLLEEAGEVIQVLGKLIEVNGSLEHWSGDLYSMLIEELGDLSAALLYFKEYNFTPEGCEAIDGRAKQKYELYQQWDEETRTTHLKAPRPPSIMDMRSHDFLTLNDYAPSAVTAHLESYGAMAEALSDHLRFEHDTPLSASFVATQADQGMLEIIHRQAHALAKLSGDN